MKRSNRENIIVLREETRTNLFHFCAHYTKQKNERYVYRRRRSDQQVNVTENGEDAGKRRYTLCRSPRPRTAADSIIPRPRPRHLLSPDKF